MEKSRRRDRITARFKFWVGSSLNEKNTIQQSSDAHKIPSKVPTVASFPPSTLLHSAKVERSKTVEVATPSLTEVPTTTTQLPIKPSSFKGKSSEVIEVTTLRPNSTSELGPVSANVPTRRKKRLRSEIPIHYRSQLLTSYLHRSIQPCEFEH